MSPRPQALQTIQFVGQKSLCGGDIGARGTHSWVFIQLVDQGPIIIGAHITIIRQHPLHQDSLASMASSADASTPGGRGVLLRGTIMGLSGVKDGEALFAVSDDLKGGLTSVRMPIRHTDIDLEGGWTWMVRPLWGGRGPLLKFPAFISPRSLWSPGSLPGAKATLFVPRDF